MNRIIVCLLLALSITITSCKDEHQDLKEPKDEGRLHHDRPNMTNPQNENRKKFTKKTR